MGDDFDGNIAVRLALVVLEKVANGARNSLHQSLERFRFDPEPMHVAGFGVPDARIGSWFALTTMMSLMIGLQWSW